ncbi:MAG: hypothetical protein AAF292_10220 [Pseudomonadota bacterium]
MLWLLVQMGSLLGLAALFGTFIGWAVRGLLLKGRARRAMVERDVAHTELDQARAELDGLYAAQKSGVAAAAEAGDAALKQELQEREEKVHSLSSALASSQEQLEKLKALKASGVALASGVAASAAETANPVPALDDRFDGAIHQPSADLEWRNRYLESRVRTLEGKMDRMASELETAEEGAADMLDVASEATPPITDAAEPAVAETEIIANGSDDVMLGHETEKMEWLNSYLRQRLAYMESHPIAEREALYAPTADQDEVAVAMVDNSATESAADTDAGVVADDPQPDTQAAAASSGELEQELARLRWRNRYLEGRLAYIEGDVERSEEGVASEQPAGTDAAQPAKMDRPDDDGDDLTQIRGLTSSLETALNDIGIWQFTQIASWSKENVAWVGQHLSNDTDANIQDWVELADVLAKGGGSA